MREKLMLLLHRVQDGGYIQGLHVTHLAHVSNETVADNLIANDVTIPVRCKDCKYGKPTAWYSAKLKCCHPSHMNSQVPHEVLPDHFCSYGERRTDGNQT